jgi:hypothetical protein
LDSTKCCWHSGIICRWNFDLQILPVLNPSPNNSVHTSAV